MASGVQSTRPLRSYFTAPWGPEVLLQVTSLTKRLWVLHAPLNMCSAEAALSSGQSGGMGQPPPAGDARPRVQGGAGRRTHSGGRRRL